MALKVFDLQCNNGHVFEGWFASHADYDEQREQGLLSCPLCQSQAITRRPSAARLNLGHAAPAEITRNPGSADNKGNEGNTDNTAADVRNNHSTHNNHDTRNAHVASATPDMIQLQAAWLRRMREAVHAAQDVGPRFSEEARRMHAGEIEERAIKGTATLQEREALAEEGIAVMPVPDFLDDDRMQ